MVGPQLNCLLQYKQECNQLVWLTCWHFLFCESLDAINVHKVSFKSFQPPSFSLRLLPFPFLTEHSLKILSPSIEVFRIVWILEGPGVMKIG